MQIFLGPMSKRVIDAVIRQCERSNSILTLIPSRRQIDFDSGYVDTTRVFVEYVRSRSDKVRIQRDHAGPQQGSEDDTGFTSTAVDCSCGFDLIHIDPWLAFPDFEASLYATINLIADCVCRSETVRFEVGTEEAIRPYEADELDDFLSELRDKLKGTFDRVEFAAIQAGTRLEGTTNTGIFDEQRCKDMIAVCEKYGLKSKEHNGDYLSAEELQKRIDLGIDGINIAPELGVIETTTLLGIFSKKDLDKFFELCRDSNKWVKWFPKGFDPEEHKLDLMRATGHYVFGTPEFQKLVAKYDVDIAIEVNLDGFLGRLCRL